jgi:hypothetical protein
MDGIQELSELPFLVQSDSSITAISELRPPAQLQRTPRPYRELLEAAAAPPAEKPKFQTHPQVVGSVWFTQHGSKPFKSPTICWLNMVHPPFFVDLLLKNTIFCWLS